MKAAIPNALTLCNLVCGAIAVLGLIYGDLDLVVWLVGIGILADFLDGAVARWLKVSSPLGRELDSLADVVSFGVVPGVIFYGLIATSLTGEQWPQSLYVPALPAFLLSAFAALRLAKFNLDERQSEGFIGLPTPSVTIFTIGLLLLYRTNMLGVLLNPWVLYLILALLSWLMHANLPMFSLKFKSFQWEGNEIKYIFVVTSAVLLFALKGMAIALLIVVYICLSAGLYLYKQKK